MWLIFPKASSTSLISSLDDGMGTMLIGQRQIQMNNQLITEQLEERSIIYFGHLNSSQSGGQFSLRQLLQIFNLNGPLHFKVLHRC